MKTIILSLILVAASLFASCSKPETVISGEAFVVTAGAGNYKLGLVQISAIPEKDIKPYLESKRNDAEVDGLRKLVQQRTAEMTAASKAATDITTRPIPSDNYSSSESLEELNRKHERVMREIDLASDQAKAARQRLDTSLSKLSDAVSNLNLATGGDRYFDALPSTSLTATTDSDGKYTLKLPQKGRYVIAAKAVRKVGETSELYYWMVWVNADGQPKSVTLSNNNLSDSGSSDSAIQTSVYKSPS